MAGSSFRPRKIKFRYKGSDYQGTLINESEGYVTIKLRSGYDIVASSSEVNITEEMSGPARDVQEGGEAIIGSGPGKVTIIATGGTISSRVDYSTGAVTPSNDISFLSSTVADLEKRFTVDLESRDNILSENMTPERWTKIGKWVADALHKSHGVIVSHGTDTMSYTASAISFMLEQQTGPVIFVGSQRSPDRPSSDAFGNIEGAIHFASAEIGEVGISMHQGTSDDRISFIRATRSRKMHTSRRDAFKAIGEKPMAFYSDGSVVIDRIGRRPAEEVELRQKLDPSVGLFYFHPTVSGEDLLHYSEGKKAVILMGTGLGHVADRLIEPIKQMTGEGKKIVITSQCLQGSTNLNVYSTGRKMLAAGCIQAGNMLPEVAYVKAMHVLANYRKDEFDSVMAKNLRGEVIEREAL